MQIRKAGALFAGAMVVASLISTTSTAEATTVTPRLVSGNPTCQDLGFDYGFKPGAGVAEDVAGSYADSNSDVDVTWSYAAGNTYVDWTSNIGPNAVIVKGGNAANVYDYDGSVHSDTGLVTPTNASGGPAGLSHLVFCFNYSTSVTKTADTSYTRTYAWDVEKSADQTTLTLAKGQSFTVNYRLAVTKTIASESDFNVHGTVTVHNPWPVAASSVKVTDSLLPGVELDCSATTIAPRGSITCAYSAHVADKSAGVNVATATATYGTATRTSSGSAPYAFGEPTTVINGSAELSDSFTCPDGFTCTMNGSLPESVSASGTFDYSVTVTAAECGMTGKLTNTATVGGDSSTVEIPVTAAACTASCTLTQGYWKTHSAKGPAGYDDNWANLGPLEENTPFYLSGKTWHQAFWTAPAGNPYYVLAHQFMAAELNRLNGSSSTPAVDAALAGARSFFATASPTTKWTKEQKAQLTAWAATLDAYNNGLIGPGHCSQ